MWLDRQQCEEGHGRLSVTPTTKDSSPSRSYSVTVVMKSFIRLMKQQEHCGIARFVHLITSVTRRCDIHDGIEKFKVLSNFKVSFQRQKNVQ